MDNNKPIDGCDFLIMQLLSILVAWIIASVFQYAFNTGFILIGIITFIAILIIDMFYTISHNNKYIKS